MEVLGTVPPLAYFTWVWYKGSLGLVDAVVLLAMYFAYLAVLWRLPPEREEGLADAPRVSRWAYTRPGIWRGVAIAGLFIGGGALIYLTAHPFLDSMLALAAIARRQPVRVRAVGGAVHHGVPGEGERLPLGEPGAHGADGDDEHDVEQHQPVDGARGDDPDRLLARARRAPAALPFDGPQRDEILLTLLQSVGRGAAAAEHAVRLVERAWCSSSCGWRSSSCRRWRDEVAWVYGAWAVGLVLSWAWRAPMAPRVLWKLLQGAGGRMTIGRRLAAAPERVERRGFLKPRRMYEVLTTPSAFPVRGMTSA